MDAVRIVKAAIPGADDALIDHIIWARTPYPFGEVTPRGLYKAASRFIRAHEHKLRLCEFCDRLVVTGGWTCKSCRDGLERCRAAHA